MRQDSTVVTEIYICKESQALEEGRLELSHDITRRDDAESDAVRRCGIDRSIHKVAYYALGESGDFRLIFTYTNPHPVSKEPKPKNATVQPLNRKKKARKTEKPKTLVEKLTAPLRRD